MTREEQIQQAAEAFDIKIISNPWTLFERGAEWADEHPSEEVMKRVAILYKDWLVKQDIDNTPIEYIKEHWNDKNIR